MLRRTVQLFVGFALLTLVSLHAQYPQPAASAQTRTAKVATAMKKPAAQKLSNAIALAMSAGAAAITTNATIIGCGGASCADMNEMANGQKQLRAGTNGWVCYALRDGPMCLDKEWRKWMEAWMSKSEPKIEGTGIAYMLRGDTGASNTDPFAMARSASNQWVVAPPHIMVLFQDPKMLDAYSTDPKNGGPWVMWKGTPYAHVMVPVSTTKAATMSSK